MSLFKDHVDFFIFFFAETSCEICQQLWKAGFLDGLRCQFVIKNVLKKNKSVLLQVTDLQSVISMAASNRRSIPVKAMLARYTRLTSFCIRIQVISPGKKFFGSSGFQSKPDEQSQLFPAACPDSRVHRNVSPSL